MIVVRFKVQSQAERAEEVAAVLNAVVAPSRATEGVVSFDIARDLSEPNTFVATEVFADEAARQRQEALPEVGAVMAVLPGAVVGPPEINVYRAEELPAAGG